MEAFWETWGTAIGQGIVLLGIAASFGVGVAPQIGDRRRVENLKLGAETLAVLTRDEDRRAVERFMSRERDLLLGKVAFSGASLLWMGVLVLSVVIFAPLIAAEADPSYDPVPMWWAFGAMTVAIPTSYILGRIVGRAVRRRRVERRRAQPNAAPQSVVEEERASG